MSIIVEFYLFSRPYNIVRKIMLNSIMYNFTFIFFEFVSLSFSWVDFLLESSPPFSSSYRGLLWKRTSSKHFIDYWFLRSMISSFNCWNWDWRSLSLSCITCKTNRRDWRVGLLNMVVLYSMVIIKVFSNSNHSILFSIWKTWMMHPYASRSRLQLTR